MGIHQSGAEARRTVMAPNIITHATDSGAKNRFRLHG
jgi:hypothetical protein